MGNEESPKPKIEKDVTRVNESDSDIESDSDRAKRDLEYHPINETIDIGEALRQLEKSLVELEKKFPPRRLEALNSVGPISKALDLLFSEQSRPGGDPEKVRLLYSGLSNDEQEIFDLRTAAFQDVENSRVAQMINELLYDAPPDAVPDLSDQKRRFRIISNAIGFINKGVVRHE